jgi:hypothetical protein
MQPPARANDGVPPPIAADTASKAVRGSLLTPSPATAAAPAASVADEAVRGRSIVPIRIDWSYLVNEYEEVMMATIGGVCMRG